MSSCLLYPLPSVTISPRLGSICGNFLIIENHGNLEAPLLGNSGCTFGTLHVIETERSIYASVK